MNNLFSPHGFELSNTELEQFSHFLALFQEYNAHTNLSAIRDEDGIIEKHFIDSLYGALVFEDKRIREQRQEHISETLKL